MVKISTTLIASLLTSFTLAEGWNYVCFVNENSLRSQGKPGQYSLTCDCTVQYYDKTVKLNCSSITTTPGSSCNTSEYAYSEDKSINASITSCSTYNATIDANRNYGKHEQETFPILCSNHNESKFCRGLFPQNL